MALCKIKKIQTEIFGRTLQGYKDKLFDYRLAQVKIADKEVVALSGKTHHPIAVPSIGDNIDGKVFKITPAELIVSDKYEVDAYTRIMGEFESGQAAWVYVYGY